MFSLGFQEFSRTSGAYLAKVPLVHKLGESREGQTDGKIFSFRFLKSDFGLKCYNYNGSYLVAVGTLVISTILIGGFHFFRGKGKVNYSWRLVFHVYLQFYIFGTCFVIIFIFLNKVNHQDEGLFQKLKKYKVVKVSLNAVDRLLHIIESLIVPSSMFLLYIYLLNLF